MVLDCYFACVYVYSYCLSKCRLQDWILIFVSQVESGFGRQVTSYVHGASELLGVQIDAAINAGAIALLSVVISNSKFPNLQSM